MLPFNLAKYNGSFMVVYGVAVVKANVYVYGQE